MIKTTLTKLRKAYSTLSFSSRAIGVETNGKFYKLIASLLRRADKRRKEAPDREEEECERAEVMTKLMLVPSETAALFARGLSKPEALQKSSFLAPSVDQNQRKKSTLSNQDDSKQNNLNNPKCDLQEAAESMPKTVPHSMIQPEPQVAIAPQSATETLRQETVFGETRNVNPPNSLDTAIPDIILDKSDDCLDGKTTDTNILSSPEKISQGNFNNIKNNIGPIKINDMLKSNHSSYVQQKLLNRVSDSPSIKFFASYDKTKKPSSTETNTTFDELAKQCLDSPNHKIDERLLKEIKKLGVPQTGPKRENSVIEENIIQMDVLRKPRRPAEKTEIDVETTKFEHPPLNYSDEQRLEFEPSNAEEEEDLLESIQKNKKDSLLLASQFCNVRPPAIESDKLPLNPFDKRNIKSDGDGNCDLKNAKNYHHAKAVQSEIKNDHHVISLNCQQIYKPPEFPNISKSNANNEKTSFKPLEIPSNPMKLFNESEDNTIFRAVNKSNAVELQPKSELDSAGKFADVTRSSSPFENSNTVKIDLSKEPEKNTDNLTMNSTPICNLNTVDHQSEGQKDLAKQENNADNVSVNFAPVNQDFKVADESKVLSKPAGEKVYMAAINSTPLSNPIVCQDPNLNKSVDFQAEGELEYSEQTENKTQVIEKPKRRTFRNNVYEHLLKVPEPLLVFNPPETRSAKVSVRTNQIENPSTKRKGEEGKEEENLPSDHHVAFVQNLKSLQIRCNVLPTKNTPDKATISLLVEIDAIKQPREEYAAQQQPDVTYRENSTNQHGNRSIPYLKNVNDITRDKVTLILPAKREKTNEAKADSIPEEKPEIPLSEMLKRVRSRNRAEYCHQLEKTLEQEMDVEVDTVTGKCGDGPPKCPPPQKHVGCPPPQKSRCRPPQKSRCPPPQKSVGCPPPQKSRCPPPATPPSSSPACPRPCKPACPPRCPPPCPKPCGPSRKSSANPCAPSKGKKGRNPCCPGASSPGRKGGNPCCPGASSSGRKGGNPCCPGASSSGKKGGNPCAPGGSSSPGKGGNPCGRRDNNPCKFSMHIPTFLMNSIVSMIHQRVTTAESDLAQNKLFIITKEAYQTFLSSACFAESHRPRLLPILNMCGIESSCVNDSMLARDYAPWVPIPCWPAPKKGAKEPLRCPKGCPIPLPTKNRPPCHENPCRGFPKRKNSFSIIDLYACWSKSSGTQ